MLCKTESGLSYNTQIKCPKCGKVVEIPEESMTTLNRDPAFTKIKLTTKNIVEIFKNTQEKLDRMKVDKRRKQTYLYFYKGKSCSIYMRPREAKKFFEKL